MPTFTSPQRTSNLSAGAKRDSFWGHFGAQPRGRSVVKIAGTWTIVDNPTNAQITASTRIIDTNGESVPGVLLGGHVTPVTSTIAAELTAAGLGSYLS